MLLLLLLLLQSLMLYFGLYYLTWNCAAYRLETHGSVDIILLA